MQNIQRLSIIVPAYNEDKTIRRIMDKILAVRYPVQTELIVVDDHSSDGTFEILQKLAQELPPGRIRILRNEVNQGKGYSIRRGIETAGGDAFIIQDADFEYEPEDIPLLLTPLMRGEADVVYGSRFRGRFWPAGMALANMVANRFLTLLTNLLFFSRLSDMETCYKLVKKSALAGIRLKTKRFDFEPEITCKLIKKGIRILELPIRYNGRTAREGKKIKARDFFIAIAVLLRNRFSDA